jgi:tRNA (guanosine-2'-O-)-methyltransferase
VVPISDESTGGTLDHGLARYRPAVSDAIDRAIATFGADAVCAALEPLLTSERIARIDAVLAARLCSVIPVVEDTYDPHNAAAAIRTTEALGLGELHVIEPGDDRFSAAKGITRGAHRWIELRRWKRPEDAVAALRGRGFRVYATLPGAPHTIEDVDVTGPIAIAFGNEHAGLSDAAIAACDGALGVPMYGFTESFNLSVTVALAMSRIATRRRAALGTSGDLEDARRRELRARWFALKIRGAPGILERTLGGAAG